MKKMTEYYAFSKILLFEKEKIKCQFNFTITNDSTSFQRFLKVIIIMRKDLAVVHLFPFD